MPPAVLPPVTSIPHQFAIAATFVTVDGNAVRVLIDATAETVLVRPKVQCTGMGMGVRILLVCEAAFVASSRGFQGQQQQARLGLVVLEIVEQGAQKPGNLLSDVKPPEAQPRRV